MKTKLDLPAALLRKAKAAAALRGISMNLFLQEALETACGRKFSRTETVKGWRLVFGRAPRGARQEVDLRVNRKFRRIGALDKKRGW